MTNTLNLRDFHAIVILTGAGVSVASGIRPFRGKNGLWEEMDIMEYATMDALRQDPGKVWRFLAPLRRQLQTTEPNRAHQFLADAEKAVLPKQNFTLITQNIDGLHQKAGSKNVIEMHGNVFMNSCSRKGCKLKPYFDPGPYSDSPPDCPVCGASLRMGPVLFDEPIPMEAQKHSKRALRHCDLFIAIGTSGDVYPAAGYVQQAKAYGAHTILVNNEDAANSRLFHHTCSGRAEEILPVILRW